MSLNGVAPALRTERQRREGLLALGDQLLRGTPLEQLAVRAALLAQEELRVDVCRIWRPRGAGGASELLASAGDADETRHRAPPAPRELGEPKEVPGGIAFGVQAAGGPAVIALYADREI
jgi:hypothetical protein